MPRSANITWATFFRLWAIPFWAYPIVEEILGQSGPEDVRTP